jgi:hypothetical protein
MGDGSGEAAAQKSEPHYLGHRERLRARFMEAGPDALPDYELLELLLAAPFPAATPSRSPRRSWLLSAASPMCSPPRLSG